MATTNLQTYITGNFCYQSGNGVPDHDSAIYTLYINLDTGINYINSDGASAWEFDNPIRIVVQKSFADTPYTASWGEDVEVDCTNGNVVINLPTAINNSGETINVQKIDGSANKITIDGNGDETINGSSTRDIDSEWENLVLRSNNVNITIK